MKRKSICNAAARTVVSAIILGLGSGAGGCWASDPCDPGQVVRFDSCFPGPVATADASGEGGAGEGGSTEGGASDGGAVPSSFGKTCSTATDCAAGSPICGAPQLPYCTQINCQAGEANAGACPTTGWQCLKVGSNPSVCLKSS
jgi:hypothetical protein